MYYIPHCKTTFDEQADQYLVSLALSSSGEYNTWIGVHPEDSTSTSIKVQPGGFALLGKSSFLNKVPNEWFEKSNTFDIYLWNDSLETEDAEKATIDFLNRMTSYQKPITLTWKKSYEDNDYHDEQTVRALLKKHYIDTTNILVTDQ